MNVNISKVQFVTYEEVMYGSIEEVLQLKRNVQFWKKSYNCWGPHGSLFTNIITIICHTGHIAWPKTIDHIMPYLKIVKTFIFDCEFKNATLSYFLVLSQEYIGQSPSFKVV